MIASKNSSPSKRTMSNNVMAHSLLLESTNKQALKVVESVSLNSLSHNLKLPIGTY